MREVLLVPQGQGAILGSSAIWAPFPMSDVGIVGPQTALLWCSALPLGRLPGAGEYVLTRKEGGPWPQSPPRRLLRDTGCRAGRRPTLGPGFALCQLALWEMARWLQPVVPQG